MYRLEKVWKILFILACYSGYVLAISRELEEYFLFLFSF